MEALGGKLWLGLETLEDTHKRTNFNAPGLLQRANPKPALVAFSQGFGLGDF